MEGIFVVTYRNFHKNSTMWRYDSNLYMKFHHRSHEQIICLWGFQKKRCDSVAVLVGKLAIKRVGWYGYRDIPFGPFGFLWSKKSLVTGRRQDRCLAMKWKEFLAFAVGTKKGGHQKRNETEAKSNEIPTQKPRWQWKIRQVEDVRSIEHRDLPMSCWFSGVDHNEAEWLGGLKFWLISKMFGLPDYHYRLWRGHGS